MFDTTTSLLESGQGWQEVDRSTLSGIERVELMRSHYRLICRLQAELYDDILSVTEAVAEVDRVVGYEYAPTEIATALTWTRRKAESEFSFAWQLADFPRVQLALRSGRIDVTKAKIIVFGLTGVDRGQAEHLAAQLLEKAEKQTSGQLRHRLRRLLLETFPEAGKDRYEEGLGDRKVLLDANDDGTANLHLYHLPPDEAALAFDRLDSYARRLATGEEKRNLDQLRADVGLDLLVGCLKHQESGRRPIVDLRVDLTTLMELDEKPGEIPGWGPVVSDLARQLAQQQKSQWRFYVVDEGDIVAEGTTRRRPTRSQRRRIETRYPHCVFPGCRAPSTHSDIDHRIRWADGGPTEDHNLTPLCEHDHPAKDEGGWKVECVDPYTFQWTSPLGVKHLVEIEPP